MNRTQLANRNGHKQDKVSVNNQDQDEEDFEILLEGEKVEIRKESKYLGALTTNNYDETKEIRRRTAVIKQFLCIRYGKTSLSVKGQKTAKLNSIPYRNKWI